MEESKELMVEPVPISASTAASLPLPLPALSSSQSASRRSSSSLSPSQPSPLPGVSRRSSASTAASVPSLPPVLPSGRSTSPSVKGSSPLYLSAISAYSASLSAPSASAPFVSPFSSSSLYSLSPHSLSLLFQCYAESGADSQGVSLSSFQALLTDFLQGLRRSLEERQLPELSRGVADWLTTEGGVDVWGGRVFRELDVRGSGRVERDEFNAFLPLVDRHMGERLRRGWKKATVVPRLTELANL